MSHHDIHAIISQIAQSLDCPQCKSRIQPNQIAITDIVDSDCLFDVTCHRCNSEMSLSAHIEKQTNADAMTYNSSSRLVHDSVVEESVTAEDITAIRKELKNFCGSFIETFSYY